MIRSFRTAALVALVSLAVSACMYRMPVQQGNFLEDKEINQITIGMTRTQVRYLLGTPMVADPFENSRWDYVYTFKQGSVNKAKRSHFIVHFDGDKVVKLERPTSDEG
jgi:outer membrane protein assembly factor BamE